MAGNEFLVADGRPPGLCAGKPLPRATLWTAPNVVQTPHTAGFGPYLDQRRLAILTENARRFDDGRPLLNVVDKARWF